jgi:putative ABC transport system ATP-binding protein
MSLIECRGLTRSYSKGAALITPLQDLDLDVESGDFVALMGPSGSGKTTLLNLIAGIDTATAGTLVIDGTDITTLGKAKLADWRAKNIGYIFQLYNLVPVLTAYENVEFPLLMRGMGRRERGRRVGSWLERVGILAQAKQRPDQLSGGQRQRVAIARAMAGEPKLVVADEPTANLDSENSARILDLMADINARTGTTFVFATHDPAVIARAQRVVSIRDGRITNIDSALAA